MTDLRTLEVITFAGGSAAPIYVAQAKGFFEREGLIVRDTATPSSGYQMASLVAGKFHIAGTALDNLIAYQEGQGTAPARSRARSRHADGPVLHRTRLDGAT